MYGYAHRHDRGRDQAGPCRGQPRLTAT
jgi:hypothetical protein